MLVNLVGWCAGGGGGGEQRECTVRAPKMDRVRAYVRFFCIKYNLANILLFYYRTEVLRWEIPQTKLFYHRDEVQVPQVPRMYGILIGYAVWIQVVYHFR